MSDNTQRQTGVATTKVSVYVCLGQNVTVGISNPRWYLWRFQMSQIKGL